MKRIYRITVSLIFIGTCFTKINAQVHKNCGTTEKMNELINQNPDIIKKQQELEKFTQEFAKDSHNKAGQTYVIPIVFHVLHQYGSENISDAQILDAVRILNEDYSKSNSDTTSIIPEFDSIAANCEIEFRLAQKDPFGNCTNGIDRIYTHRTNEADDFSKINQWDREKYVNVWVVKTIGSQGVAGYAYYPSAANGISYAIDGIIILHNYIGSIGTSNPTNSRALTHEIGHYLNLQHPWGSTNNPGVACGDDGVTDTPITQGFSSCPSSSSAAKICDSSIVENYQNFMDYSYCSKMFTEGQKTRMQAALNNNQSSRNKLWTQQNLIATGTNTTVPNSCASFTDFNVTKRFICQGKTITISDESWNSPTTWSWTINNASPSSSSSQNPSFTFNNLYWHSVTLTTSNANSSSSKTKTNYIYVSPPWTDYVGTFYENFEDNNRYSSQWLPVNNDYNESDWELTSSAAYTGSQSLYLSSYSPLVLSTNTTPPYIIYPGIRKNDVDAIITPAFDLSSLTGGQLNFKFAFTSEANTSTDINEQLRLYYSINCGETWSLFFNAQGTSIITSGKEGKSFFPTSSSQWKDQTVNIPAGAKQNNVRFKIEFTSGTYSNNFFIDDINISGNVGQPENNIFSDVKVFPNPSKNQTYITYKLTNDQTVKIYLYDIFGNIIQKVIDENQAEGVHNIQLNTSQLSKGIYFVKIVGSNNLSSLQKLVIQ